MPRLPDHPDLKWSEAGLRGVVGTMLHPALAAEVSAAFAATLPPGPVALCRDSRPTGPALVRAVAAALVAAGREVRDLGLVPVPTLQVYVKETACAGGIDVTASHNPVEWNALKFIGPGGYFLTREEAAAFRARFESDGARWARWDGQGRLVEDSTAARRHIDRVLAHVDVAAIRRRAFHVAIDCVNGSCSRVTPVLLEALGCRVSSVHCDPERAEREGFPHEAEPRPEHLGDLCRLVRESGADVGFAQDPDGDRLALVAEGGAPLSEEYTMVLAADVVLAKRPGGPVVANLCGSRMVDDVAARFGSPVHRTRIGEINVSVRLREVGGAVGGEGNGGVIFPPVHEARDSLSGIALILEGMATKGLTLSAWAATLPAYAMVKEKIRVRAEEVAPAVEAARAALAPGAADVNLEDGVKVSWADRWVHLRGSNTEPIVRIMAEAPTEAEARALARRAREAIGR